MVLPSASLLGDLGATAACEVLSCVRPFSSLIRSHVQNHGPHVGIITWAGAREIARAEPWSTRGHHHLGWGQGDRSAEPWSTRGHRHLGWGQGSLATAVVIVQTGKQVGRAENGSESLQGVHTCRAGV